MPERKITPDRLIHGAGSGLDADQLDGMSSESFATAAGLSALDGRVTQAESDIDTAEGRLDNAEGNITSLDGRLTTAEGNISQNESDIDGVKDDLDSHVSDTSNPHAVDIDDLSSLVLSLPSDTDPIVYRSIDGALTNLSSYNAPTYPTFEAVASGDGRIYVELACTDPVEGFELCTSETTTADPDNRVFSRSGRFEIQRTAPVYLFARTMRGQKYSDWVAYGDPAPGQEEFSNVWDDPILGGTYEEYPNFNRLLSSPKLFRQPDPGYARIRHGLDSEWCFGYFNATSPIEFSEYGGRVDAQLCFTAQVADKIIGLLLGARQEMLTTPETEEHYFLGLRWPADNDCRAQLWKMTGNTFDNLIAQSANIYPTYFQTGTLEYRTRVRIERQNRTFRVYVGNSLEYLALEQTDSTILPSSARSFIGLRMTNGTQGIFGKYGYHFIVDKRLVSGEKVAVDPGKQYDELDYLRLSDPFIASQNLLSHTGNTNDDVIRPSFSDAGAPILKKYNLAGVFQEDVSLEPAISKNSAFNKDFAGTGSADTVARSDHDHDLEYAAIGHDHDSDYAGITHAGTHATGQADAIAPADIGAAAASHTHTGVYCRWRGVSATDPADPEAGDIYKNSGDSKPYLYDGSAWIALA